MASITENGNLTVDRLKAIEAMARPAVAPCMCGCEETTKGRFFPGHDATLKRDLAKAVANGSKAEKERAARILEVFGW